MERVQSGVSPDLLILDLPRADTDALHFLRWLRRLRPELPIIVICDRKIPPRSRKRFGSGPGIASSSPWKIRDWKRAIRTHLSTAGDTARSGTSPVTMSSKSVTTSSLSEPAQSCESCVRRLNCWPRSMLRADPRGEWKRQGDSGPPDSPTIRQVRIRVRKSQLRSPTQRSAGDRTVRIRTEWNRNFRQSKPGKLELCEKGTILLDEITEMPMTLQAKLLQVLQTRQFARPGSGTVVPVDVRILTASTTNVEPAISENKLREDLYYHLSSYTIRVPALRERREEVPLLLHYFMRHLANQYALSPRTFSMACIGGMPSALVAWQSARAGNFRKALPPAGGR